MHDDRELPESGKLLRHSDGGIYRFLTTAKHAEDGTQMMDHHRFWPFEPDTWPRAALLCGRTLTAQRFHP
jgi:hypothetical protein